MLAITVDILHGTYRAASYEDATLTGTPSAEWPPSPARLYQAFVAGAGTGNRCTIAEGETGLELLESPPLIRADLPPRPAGDNGDHIRRVLASTLQSRYVVADATAPGTVQDYSGRLATKVRPGIRLAPFTPRIAYVWPDAEPDASELSGLRRRAQRVPYLGTSDSPVRVRVLTELPLWALELPEWAPDRGGSALLPVAYPGFRDDLDRQFEAWTKGPHRKSWSGPLLAQYRSPEQPEHAPDSGICVWLRFDASIAGRRVLAVADTMRKAVLERAALIAGRDDDVPAVVHGHRQASEGSEHVRYLPLPDVDHPYSDGRLRGICVWLPPGVPAADAALTRQAVQSVQRLVLPGVFDVAVSPFDGTRRPWASHPKRWQGPAQLWTTAFPVVHDRRVRGSLTLEELGRWCEWAGLPKPVAFQTSPVPFARGAARLSPSEVFRGADRRRYEHLRIAFEKPVEGPIAIGRGRHFGLGLLFPKEPTPNV